MRDRVEVAIVGAGPYGLSIATHLRAAGVAFRIFGRPMESWRDGMPTGMLLKSDGFASNLADPGGAFTLGRFCAETGVPYDDLRIPIRLDTFTAYGLAFQRRLVPDLEDTKVLRIVRDSGGYVLHCENGENARAQRVILAVGITYFQHVPDALKDLASTLRSHSAMHKDVNGFRGRDVAVVGGGASAIDTAVLLAEAGVNVTLISRRAHLKFATPPAPEDRFWRSLRQPSSLIGPGWRSRLYCELPHVFHRLPPGLRLELVRRHNAPGAGWPMKSRFEAKVPALLGRTLRNVAEKGGRARLVLAGEGGVDEHTSDHVIAATGFKVDVRSIPFLDEGLVARLKVIDGAPMLSSTFESSIPHLYFVGPAAVSCFGPLMRFVCGATWTAKRIATAIARSRVPAPRRTEEDAAVA